MSSSTFVLLSGTLTFGAPLLWAMRELVLLRRDRGGSGGPEQWCRNGTPTPPGPRGGAREHMRPLPACLIEAAQGARAASPKPTLAELESA